MIYLLIDRSVLQISLKGKKYALSLIKNVVITSTKENEMVYAVSFSYCCCYFFFFSLIPSPFSPPPPLLFLYFFLFFSFKKSLQDLFLLSYDVDMKEVFFTSGFYCMFSFVIWENIFSGLSLQFALILSRIKITWL